VFVGADVAAASLRYLVVAGVPILAPGHHRARPGGVAGARGAQGRLIEVEGAELVRAAEQDGGMGDPLAAGLAEPALPALLVLRVMRGAEVDSAVS
jgi:hypothetical protein